MSMSNHDDVEDDDFEDEDGDEDFDDEEDEGDDDFDEGELDASMVDAPPPDDPDNLMTPELSSLAHPNTTQMVAGAILKDRYRFGELIYDGNAKVYQARDRNMDEPCIVKVASGKDACDRMERERNLGTKCYKIPGLVRIRDRGFDRANKIYYLVFDWLDGENLEQRLSRGALPWQEAVRIGRKVAETLTQMHGLEVLHRDIKPANIFLCRDGDVRVLDLGLATGPGVTQLTEEGYTLGTTPYSSPEQFNRPADADARTDIYGLGLTLAYAIAGERVLPGYDQTILPDYTTHARLRMKLDKALPSLPKAVVEVVERACRANRTERYPTAAEFALALAELEEMPQREAEAAERAKREAIEAEERARREALEEEERTRRAALDAEERAKREAIEAEERARRQAMEAEEREKREAAEAEEREKREAAAAEERAKHEAATARLKRQVRWQQAGLIGLAASLLIGLSTYVFDLPTRIRVALNHVPKKWEQAVDQQRAGLSTTAAKAFDAIAALHVGDLSDRAEERAKRLRTEDNERHQAWKEVSEAGKVMAKGGAIPFILVDRQPGPGYLRLYLYDAVRSATTRERVVALVPFAQALDVQYKSNVLVPYAEGVVASWTPRRAEFAKTYAKLMENPQSLKAGALDVYLNELRQAGQVDQLYGALVLTGRAGDDPTELRRLADATGDPWFVVKAEIEQARYEYQKDHPWETVEQLLLSALHRCEANHLEFRCIEVDHTLTYLNRLKHNLPGAENYAERGWKRALDTNDWQAELSFLVELGEIARLRGDNARAAAFIEETYERNPEACDQRLATQLARADGLMGAQRFTDARDEMLSTPKCGKPMPLLGLGTLAHLDRVRMPAIDLTQLRTMVSELRDHGRLNAGQSALLRQIEGFLLLRHNRTEGRAILRAVIDVTKAVANDDARHARVAAFNELAFDAARDRDFATALRESMQGESAPGCVLSVVVSYERTLVVARGGDGRVHGNYDERRRSPHIDSSHLVPAEIQSVLNGCQQVAVFSPPFLHARDMLPPNIAWAVHDQRRPVMEDAKQASSITRATTPIPGLMITEILTQQQTDQEPPLWLQPLLLSLSPNAASGPQLLQGVQSTPVPQKIKIGAADAISFYARTWQKNRDIYAAVAGSAILNGKYRLTAAEIAQLHLNAPLVILQSPAVGEDDSLRATELHSMPSALIEAGARGVLVVGPTAKDAQVGEFLVRVIARYQTGEALPVALRNERMAWLDAGWAKNIIAHE